MFVIYSFPKTKNDNVNGGNNLVSDRSFSTEIS